MKAITCYRSRDNWHSYVKNSLSEVELAEMTSHLANCSECREAVSLIRETIESFAKKRVILNPPDTIKLNIMMAIDKKMYLETSSPANSFALRNWGFSMIAAGILLFALNLSPLNQDFATGQVTELHNGLSKQIAIPFDKIGRAANDALEKIESLKLPKQN